MSLSPNSPADGLSLDLLVQPGLQWRDVVDDRGCVHLLGAGQGFESFRPGLGATERQHRVQPLTGFLAFIDGAAVERRRAARRLRQCAMELELENLRQEISRIRHVCRYMVLGARIEKTLRRALSAAPRPDISSVAPTTLCCNRPEKYLRRKLSTAIDRSSGRTAGTLFCPALAIAAVRCHAKSRALCGRVRGGWS